MNYWPNLVKAGWFFEKEKDGTIVVTYQSWHLHTSYKFSFEDADSANTFWEIVYPLVRIAEHDPIVVRDATGWNMRNMMVRHYCPKMKPIEDAIRATWLALCVQLFVKPFLMCKSEVLA